MNFSIIAAADSKLGIGKNGRLPWNLPTDLKFFHDKTIGRGRNVVAMGRTTWESIPELRRPLPKRTNIILTHQKNYPVPKGVFVAESLEKGLRIASQCVPEEIYIIGGAKVYYDALKHPDCKTIYLTEIDGVFDCDAFFPKIDPAKFKKIRESKTNEENGVQFRFTEYDKKLNSA